MEKKIFFFFSGEGNFHLHNAKAMQQSWNCDCKIYHIWHIFHMITSFALQNTLCLVSDFKLKISKNYLNQKLESLFHDRIYHLSER